MGVDAEVTGLDYNEHMLGVARAGEIAKSDRVHFVRGDAMDLTAIFAPDSFNAVTQVFGVGGIPEPMKVFDGVLRILRPNGRFLMTDMHKPIPQFPGEWPLLLKWLRFPLIEAALYEQVTIPLVLKRLWGWRDTTACFYQLPLITFRDGDGRYWGFEVKSLEQESQRWWFAVPLMPVARIVVEKTEITERVASERQAILAACSAP